jgi:hypothetical protein
MIQQYLILQNLNSMWLEISKRKFQTENAILIMEKGKKLSFQNPKFQLIDIKTD